MRAETLLPSLAMANLVFSANKSPDELLALADIFAEALAGELDGDVQAAFALHRKRGRRFPVPAEIADLLCECRPRPSARQEADGTATPGYGRAMGLAILDKLRNGGFQEEAGAVCARVMAGLKEGLPQ